MAKRNVYITVTIVNIFSKTTETKKKKNRHKDKNFWGQIKPSPAMLPSYMGTGSCLGLHFSSPVMPLGRQ